MYNQRYLICFLCVVLAFNAKAQKSSSTVIGFYNCENLFDAIDDPKTKDEDFTPKGLYQYTDVLYRKKLQNIAQVLGSMGKQYSNTGAALIGLVEIENDKVLKDLVGQQAIKSRGYKYAWFNSHDERGIDVALLYQPEQFKLLSARAVPVDINHNGFLEATRDILFVSGMLHGDTVYILVNHWPSRREGVRKSAGKRATVAKLNRQICDSLLARNPHCRIIVMGDLNDNPTDENIAKIMGAKANPTSKTEFYNPWVEPFIAGTGTLVHDKKWQLYDQILLSRAFTQHSKGLQFGKAEIYAPDFVKQAYGHFIGYPRRAFTYNRWLGGYSDHFAVMIVLKRG